MNIPRFFRRQGRPLLLGITLLLGSGGLALAVIAPDVVNTRHNLSATNSITSTPGSSFGTTVKATSETQVCVFCHTPHAATSGIGPGIVAPLWNRTLSTQTYTFYDSSSLDANPKPGQNVILPGVGVGSKLCLSCHDGTLAIGTVGVLNNNYPGPSNISMQGTDPGGTMPSGTAGANTGFTRKIGVDLTNDHPISFTFDAAQATRDGELYTPGASGVAVASRVQGVRPMPQFPLIGPLGGQGNQVECITCHDPHLKTDAVDPITGLPVDNKFLRGNRFQLGTPQDGVFNPATDIMCLACHNKPSWATSTHANILATSEQYKDSAADLRDFPRNTQVWQAACLNCHDVHTVPGSRRLLREGTDSVASPKTGGNPAIEQTCFQCHSPPAERALVQESPDQVPDIKTDFNLPYHMPIVTAEQGEVPPGGGSTFNPTSPGEIHDIGKKTTDPSEASNLAINTAYGTNDNQRGKDMMELRSQLGAGTGSENLINRHVECPDCHQPHRLSKTQLFNGDPTVTEPSGTHRHAGSGDPGGIPHSNLASGVLRGAFGVEPLYSSNSFYSNPSGFIEKRGPVPVGASTDVTNSYLTREYQICAKCHSNYALPNARPSLGRTGGSPFGTNGMQIYTNVFREIQAPITHRGEVSTSDSGAYAGITPYFVGPNYNVNFQTNNHRGWHPVMGITGRTPAIRNANGSNWLAPWTNDVGNLTMYCTDCHGSSTAAGTVVPNGGEDGNPWGPHGSTNIFILKGWWDNCTGTNLSVSACLNNPVTVSLSAPANTAVRPTIDTTQDLCFKCHDYNIYGNPTGGSSGFGGIFSSNLHATHRSFVGKVRCMWCHVAVPHGWKNKALLVNLNDVGPEATCRQEDADDVPVGYKCTETVGLGNPMLPGTQMRANGIGSNPAGPANPSWQGVGYTNPPYYRNAMVKIHSFAPSGQWDVTNCGSIGAPGNGAVGGWTTWMGSSEGCNNAP